MPRPINHLQLPTAVGRLAPTVAEYNALRSALRGCGCILHGATTSAIATADATDAATTIALANAMKSAYTAHIADTDAHLAADSTNTISAADATDQASANTLLNEIKGDFNAHHKSGTYHTVGGEGGIPVPADVSTADATDAATSVTLANALKVALNLHFASGFAAASGTD